jgi:hypothetical protein
MVNVKNMKSYPYDYELEVAKLALYLIGSCGCHHHIKVPWLPHVMLTIHLKCPKKNTREGDPAKRIQLKNMDLITLG